VKEIIAIPLLSLILVIQMAIVSRIPLLGGYADLILVTLAGWALQERATTAWHWAILGGMLVGLASGLPWIIPLAGYIFVVALARALVHRIWRAPLLAMFAVVSIGTLSIHIMSVFFLSLMGNPLSMEDALGVVTLPSLLLNLLLAIPAYPIMRDLAVWIYAIEDEE